MLWSVHVHVCFVPKHNAGLLTMGKWALTMTVVSHLPQDTRPACSSPQTWLRLLKPISGSALSANPAAFVGPLRTMWVFLPFRASKRHSQGLPCPPQRSRWQCCGSLPFCCFPTSPGRRYSWEQGWAPLSDPLSLWSLLKLPWVSSRAA